MHIPMSSKETWRITRCKHWRERRFIWQIMRLLEGGSGVRALTGHWRTGRWWCLRIGKHRFGLGLCGRRGAFLQVSPVWGFLQCPPPLLAVVPIGWTHRGVVYSHWALGEDWGMCFLSIPKWPAWDIWQKIIEIGKMDTSSSWVSNCI